MPKFVIALIIFFLILKVIAVIFEVIAVIILPIGYIVIILGSIFLIYKIYVNFYFNSKKFKKIKDSIQDYIINCNELNSHIEELKCSFLNIKSYDYGEGQLYDNSVYNLKRREWSKNIKNNLTHYCSATVCNNASNQPFKYLCKYFSIKTNEETLSNFETILNNFAAAEQGKILLQNEKELILENIKNLIPSLIYSFDKNKLVTKLGFEDVDMSDLYFPIYKFQYISAGGNSSSYCDIKLNVENLDKFVNYMSDLVNFKKSIKGQRALMTSSLREKIKVRDNFTCKKCDLSVNETKNLLLEIDHIIPLSKGGITSEDNLQTLCWKCNRSKGARL